jgi:hypothetical protein
VYLGLWAGALEQYRRNPNAFFHLYTGEPHRINEKKYENPAGILSSPGLRPLCSCEGSRTMGAFVVHSVIVVCVT